MALPLSSQPWSLGRVLRFRLGWISYSRRSTTGFFIAILGTIIRFASRTQAIHALSSAEAELYSIGSAIAEALHVKAFLEESGIAKKAQITIRTDSSSGKSMATRFGASKRTRHVHLRFLFVQHLIADGAVIFHAWGGL